jgi:SSS family solute:Na+ symporter
MSGRAIEITIFVVLFAVVTVLGFVAGRWRRANLDHLDEWGLGGRNFGAWVTWFLMGGDLYTAYTFVAVPALMFGAGAAGFFAVPYTIVVYPLVFLALIRLWSISHVHGYVTPADFVRGRSGSPAMALLVALTGIVATMPYIALQLVGIEAVLTTMGIKGHWPLIVAFAILAAYTYNSGLRAPALIAFVKDALIYLVIIVAVLYIPAKLAAGRRSSRRRTRSSPSPPTPVTASCWARTGSCSTRRWRWARPWPCSSTRTRSPASWPPGTAARSSGTWPAAGLLVPPGAPRAARLHGDQGRREAITTGGKPDATRSCRAVRPDVPSWFAGIAFAGDRHRALVPAAIMSIAAANLWTRNVYKEFLRRDATPAQEARSSKLASLVVKLGALVVILALDPQFSIDLQLIGGVIILQTLPAVALGVFSGWFHKGGLIAGWAAGMISGFWMLWNIPQLVFTADGPQVVREHFGGSAFKLSELGFNTQTSVYVGFIALLVNVVVAIAVTALLRATGVAYGPDTTQPDDYLVERGDPRVHDIPS